MVDASFLNKLVIFPLHINPLNCMTCSGATLPSAITHQIIIPFCVGKQLCHENFSISRLGTHLTSSWPILGKNIN